MKYAMFYNKLSKYRYSADELIINYNGSDGILDFLSKHNDQTVIFNIDDINSFLNDKMLVPLSVYANAKLKIPFDQIDLLKAEMEKAKVFPKFMVNVRCENWDMLYYLKNKGVSDIYITDSMGFEIKNVAKILHEDNIAIRVYPNICQNHIGIHEPNNITSFWIRPEDYELYEEYIDVFELDLHDINIYDIIYKAYAIDKKWFGKLNEIITYLNSDIDNRSLPPSFGVPRLNCGKRCMKDKSCHLCEKYKYISDIMKENGYVYNRSR